MIWTEAGQSADGDDRPAWLEARRHIITSTDIAKAMTPSGWRAVVMDKLYGAERADNAYFAHGREREAAIARAAERRYGVTPNRHLYIRDGIGATPDGIHPFYPDLAEYKTSLDPMPATTPRVYRDQVYAAQHVFDADRTLLGWEQHLNGVPLDLEPSWRWIERDQDRIDELVAKAAELASFLETERLTLAH